MLENKKVKTFSIMSVLIELEGRTEKYSPLGHGVWTERGKMGANSRQQNVLSCGPSLEV